MWSPGHWSCKPALVRSIEHIGPHVRGPLFETPPPRSGGQTSAPQCKIFNREPPRLYIIALLSFYVTFGGPPQAPGPRGDYNSGPLTVTALSTLCLLTGAPLHPHRGHNIRGGNGSWPLSITPTEWEQWHGVSSARPSCYSMRGMVA